LVGVGATVLWACAEMAEKNESAKSRMSFFISYTLRHR
jgi:hypothetical protein